MMTCLLALLVVQQLPAHIVILGQVDPLAGQDAGERRPEPGRPIQPPRRALAREHRHQPRGKMVAVLGQQVVARAAEFGRHAPDDGFQLPQREHREPDENARPERGARWGLPRLGIVHARDAAPLVASICELFVAKYDAAMHEWEAEGPEQGGEFARLEGELD